MQGVVISCLDAIWAACRVVRSANSTRTHMLWTNLFVQQGVVLGSSAGGALLYVEPGAVVPTNNELAAARGEAYAAEETVLSQLSMRCAAHAASLEAVLDALVWLDVAVAKAEYGLWTGGYLAREGGWPHERSLGAPCDENTGDDGGQLVFRLKQLRYVSKCCHVDLLTMC